MAVAAPARPGRKPGRYEVLTEPRDPFQLAAKAYFPASAPRYIHEAAKEGGKPLPSLHSDVFYPVPEPTLKTGVKTMSLAVLNLVGK